MEQRLFYKAISVRDPWSRAIFCGKDVENRSRYTHHRGPLLIHCGLRIDEDSGIDRVVTRIPRFLGGVIGIVNLVDCITNSRSKWAEKDSYHLVLRDQLLFSKAFPYRGKLGLFTIYGTELPASVMAELTRWSKTTSR